MKKWLLSVALPMAALVGAVGLGGCASSADDVEISGSVWFRERIALPVDAVLTVQVQDVSRMDVAAEVLGELKVPVTAVPKDFALRFKPDTFKQGHTYAVGARITQGDKLLFINTQSYRVDFTQPTGMSVRLDSVGR
ncbi:MULTISPECIES: YbaY family lipoprotein [Shewanella]|uniref:YbaY family lipoprotein n=1 Tax=Shewanella TaxID=22 RepID=UPI001C658E97|nr:MULTISPECIES: YbaY family lipoprotein [Shewanella]QYJ76709.1 YbaY family lipoprotein [Shewanella sp. FJAT-52076]QYK06625.1 YbaY family lipoprotein [Shewanella zhangzhouensis]